ncbi:LuxR family two component transcriptional regulator [Tenacibaculum adriaticum]|uniref:LuxR family two component transcriptional regulator n=1 Tax=Tenacibaculum adriaticum TaxID=413713 RepID=A0A5S5DTU0_9FLAO|nr:response regulator transcription factor [Tenacibaculum adriaticum]TYP99084.1 LuxR family two component transcriptional regulator [Tenacibaculum adriaticum]
MSVTIVLADDHPLLLSGNEQFLKSKGYKVVATETNGNNAYNSILKYKPSLAILDFDMPIQNGLEVAKSCVQNKLDVKIIILTLHKQEAIIKEIGSLIHGYVLKDDDLLELENCIKEVLKEKTYISKNIQNAVHLSSKKNVLHNLTVTETKILRYLAQNMSSSDIAEKLFISKRTVEKHRSNIIHKLGIKSTQNGLLLWVQKNTNLFNT